MGLSIEILSDSTISAWENFNDRSREGTFFHGIRWKAFLEGCCTPRTRYYLVRDGRKVIGICPLREQWAGYLKGLIPLPHTEFNAVILDESIDRDRFQELLSVFSERYSFLQFTTYAPELVDGAGFDTHPLEATGHMILDLKKNPPDAIWESRLTKDDRYKIRSFEKDGFGIRDGDRARDIEHFYHYYRENTKYIDGEVLPLTFFKSLLSAFGPDTVKLGILGKRDVFAGGGLTLMDPGKKTAYFEYLSLNRALPNRYTPSIAIAWDGITWAYENGYERVSFGLQKCESSNPRFRYKSRFGAEHVSLHTRLVMLSAPSSALYRLKRSAERLVRGIASFMAVS